MKICYIVGAGDIYSLPKPGKGDILIAADGGYDHLISHGLTPNFLIGDLDSIREVPKEVEIIRYPVRKDETDMLLAFEEGYARGYREFRIYGGVGGREDHTYANYSLLLYAKNRGARAVLEAKDFNVEVLRNETVNITPDKNNYFSLFAIESEARVTVKGSSYDGTDIILTPEFPLGVSNRYLSCTVSITVTEGTVLAFL